MELLVLKADTHVSGSVLILQERQKDTMRNMNNSFGRSH